MKSLVLIVPKDFQAEGNAISVAMGHDVAPGKTYSVPLSPSGSLPVTHYGCHAWATDGFAAMVRIGKSGVVPDGTDAGLAQMALGLRAQHPNFMAALIASDKPDTANASSHFDDVCTSWNLQRVRD